MVSNEAIEEISQEVRSLADCWVIGHDYKRVRQAKDKKGDVHVLLECGRCQDVQECLLTEAMARQFLLSRSPHEMKCILFFGKHKFQETDEVDLFTGKPRRICSVCGAVDKTELKKILGMKY